MLRPSRSLSSTSLSNRTRYRSQLNPLASMTTPWVPTGTPGSSTVDSTLSPRSSSSWLGCGLASGCGFQVVAIDPAAYADGRFTAGSHSRRPSETGTEAGRIVDGKGGRGRGAPRYTAASVKSTVEPLEGTPGKKLVKLSIEVD